MANSVCSKQSKLDDCNAEQRQLRLYKQYIEPHYKMIYSLCKRYSFHPSNVDENYNEVLINFYLRVNTYNPSQSLLTWLHIVTKRHIMALEKKRAKYNAWNDINELLCDTISDDHDGFQDKASAMHIDNYQDVYSDEVLEALDSMNPSFKKALLMQESGYALKEIAALEGISIGTVKSRIFHARQHLKQILDRDGRFKK